MGFIAHEVSLEMVKSVAPVIQAVARNNRALADQMERAASSVPLNVAEGRRRTGRDRKRCYRIAAGSADELRTAIRVAEAWGYVDAQSVGPVDEPLDRELALLWALTRP